MAKPFFKLGDKVKCNGNPNGVITQVFEPDCAMPFFMFTVRLWDDTRLVGEVTVGQHSLILENDLLGELDKPRKKG